MFSMMSPNLPNCQYPFAHQLEGSVLVEAFAHGSHHIVFWNNDDSPNTNNNQLAQSRGSRVCAKFVKLGELLVRAGRIGVEKQNCAESEDVWGGQ